MISAAKVGKNLETIVSLPEKYVSNQEKYKNERERTKQENCLATKKSQNIWKLQNKYLSLQRQNVCFDYPGRIPREVGLY